MKRFSSTTLKTAFVKSIPIFCSYVFVSMAYGMVSAIRLPLMNCSVRAASRPVARWTTSG